MKAIVFIRGMLIAASLVVMVGLLVSPVIAGEQPTGPASPSQKEIKAEGAKPQPAPQQVTPVPTELGKGSEQPMKVPEPAISAERQVFDLETLELMRMMDEKSAMSQ